MILFEMEDCLYGEHIFMANYPGDVYATKLVVTVKGHLYQILNYNDSDNCVYIHLTNFSGVIKFNKGPKIRGDAVFESGQLKKLIILD